MKYIRKVWITGANGRLGRAINEILNPVEVEILNTDIDDVDITDNQGVILFGDRNRPDAIINCAGLTDTRQCEENPELAFRVNALGARNLSISARKTGARIVHLSTDDVFDGAADRPYTEFDTPNPLTVYGKSKLAGENFVKEFAPKHIILRSSWVYGEGESFLTRVMEAAKRGEEIKVADDQTASPTCVKELAKLAVTLMNTAEYGVYHAACEGSCSRLEFTRAIFEYLDRTPLVSPVPYKKGEWECARPKYSVLDNYMLRISGIYKMPHWQDALKIYLSGKE